MRYYKKITAFVTIFFMLVLFIQPVGAAASDKILKILFTHDLHASFEPAVITNADNSVTESGGYGRLYTAITKERGASPDSTLLVDAGDYSMGTLFQALYKTDAPDLRMLGKMGYDAVTVGNHEFDYGLAGYAADLEAAKKNGDPLPPYVLSNMTLPKGDAASERLQKAMDGYGIQDYTVVEKSGVKIGIFGVLGEEASSYAPLSKPAVFNSIVETSKRVVKILKEKEKVDLIVCLSHSGTNANMADSEDEQLAAAVTDINVIISGHTHTVLQQPIVSGHTLIVSCGSSSAYLGVLNLVQKDGVWGLQDYNLTKIDAAIEKDAAIETQIADYKNLVDNYLKPYSLQYGEVIAKSPYVFTDVDTMFAKPGEYTLGNLATDAYTYAVKQAEGAAYDPVSVSVVPVGVLRASFGKGNITVADAFKVLSLGAGPDGLTGYPIISVYIKGSELKNICEVDASISGIMGDAQLYFSGIRYTYNPNRLLFNKVTDAVMLLPDGSTQKIDDNKDYRVVCDIYTAQMLAVVKSKSFGILSVTPRDRQGNEITDWNKQIIYGQKDGQKQELKAWQALTDYLGSFEKQDGVPVIPAAYEKTQGRKITDNATGLFSLIGGLRSFVFIALAIVLLILALIVFAIVRIVNGFKKRKLKRLAA